MSSYDIASLEKFKQHATSHTWIGNAPQYNDHPICPSCEKIALRDKGWSTNRIARCPACGYHGVSNMRLQAYVNQGLYR